MADTIFLMWYDDNPKLPINTKIEAAIAAYRKRFGGVAPNLVLVNDAEIIEYVGIRVRSTTTIGRNNYWVGLEQAA